MEAQASYGIGLQIGQQLAESGLTGLELDALTQGLRDSLEGNAPAVAVDVVHRALREMHARADEARQAKYQEASREGVTCTGSGLQFEVLQQGDGPIPARTDRVRVHYTGSLLDGTVFDSSVQRGQPAEFPVNGVIAGWIEALTLMPVGSKWRLYIPHQLAYGERGAGHSIPPCSMLQFDVELLEIL